ncbi:hypothetical protein ACI2KT_00940 [Ensifer adhaerens]|uniref:hypothetical protein n=1 Tax=Ensifer adhaerens TaxID=106592 RepID=UPI00384D9C5C
MTTIPEPVLSEADYPFIDKRFPLSELAMIEVPRSLQDILIDQSEKNGEAIIRDVPVEVRCTSDQFGDATFLIYWPHGYSMHMLAPAQFRKGNA